MSNRAPSVTWKEIDLSQVAPAMGGTAVLVAGFAAKGQDERPLNITGSASWQTIYGRPTTEAEIYFYKACMKVLDQGGSLIAAKIPYTNVAAGNYRAVDYSLEKLKSLGIEKDISYINSKENYGSVSATLSAMGISEMGKEIPNKKDYWTTTALSTLILKDKIDISVDAIADYTITNTAVTLPSTCYIPIKNAAGLNEIKATTVSEIENSLSAEELSARQYITDQATLNFINDNEEIAEEYYNATDQDKNTIYENVEYVVSAAIFGTSSFDAYYNILQNPNGTKVYKPVIQPGVLDYEKTTIRGVIDNVLSAQFVTNKIDIANGLWTFTPDAAIKTVSDDALGIYRVGLLPEENTVNQNLSTTDNQVYFDDMIEGGSIRIVDISHARLGRDNNDNEVLGVFPVILAAGNVLGDQGIIDYTDIYNVKTTFASTFKEKKVKITGFENVSPVIGVVAEDFINMADNNMQAKIGPIDFTTTKIANLTDDNPLTQENATYDTNNNYDSNLAAQLVSPDTTAMSLTRDLFDNFPMLAVGDDGAVERDYLNQLLVGVVVAYSDGLASGKINFKLAETFVGSPWKSAIDKSTGASIYLGDIINGTSNYIEFYSNLENGLIIPNQEDTTTLFFSDIVNGVDPTIDSNKVTFATKCKSPAKIAKLTGFTAVETQKNISSAQIIQSLQSIFDKVSNINALDIDIVCDAGLSNIAQFVTGKQTQVFSGKDPTQNCTQYTPVRDKWMLNSRNDTLTWRAIFAIYNTFCQNTRKDCAFTFDALRPLALEGSDKILRPTKPSNTFDLNILPKYNLLAGLNTSYGAGYSVWTLGIDDFTGNYLWLPPSIAAMGQWIYTDITANYWDAPAGLTRGILSDALDIAFNPTIKQAGLIYGKGWNYCINWPADGITLEGQKTFQVKPSAFDRINVRRLFLRLERNTYHTLKYFVYEGNTAFTRQRIVDTLDPMFSRVKVMGGLYDYKLKCDDSNNTPDIIDRNELIVDIALKPTRTAEFIQANFYALRTGASWSEAGM